MQCVSQSITGLNNVLIKDLQNSKDTFITNNVVLYQRDYDNPKNIHALVAETWNSALLDSGASKTVCGKSWLEMFKSCLSEEEAANIEYKPSNSLYKFGDGQKIYDISCAEIPAVINNRNFTIRTD